MEGTAERESDEEFVWCDIDNFLAKNEKLIFTMADRIFNMMPCDRDDMKMEAAVAYYETLDYINSFKKTKFSSVFTWFFQKRLYARKKLDAGYISQDEIGAYNAERNYFESAFVGEAMNYVSFECSADYAAAPCKTTKPNRAALEFTIKPDNCEFNLCIESFTGRVSMKAFRALMVLLEATDIKAKKKSLMNLFKCSSTKDIEKIVRARIRDEMEKNGVNLFSAVCFNGNISRVIVCGSSERDAMRYLKKYGEPTDIGRLW